MKKLIATAAAFVALGTVVALAPARPAQADSAWNYVITADSAWQY